MEDNKKELPEENVIADTDEIKDDNVQTEIVEEEKPLEEKNDIKETTKALVKDEDDFYDKKEKGKILRIVWNVFFYALLAVFAICAIFGVVNFNKVKDNKEPFGYATTKTYSVETNKEVTVYNYYAYKIVKVNDNGKTTVSLKLWFLDDVK